ncbi:MAG: DUF4832 domain-containing protein [Lachnospiraceae bacterium]|nr:DUF4832 domain-containing protein [Lachnospiraceae bacterium]
MRNQRNMFRKAVARFFAFVLTGVLAFACFSYVTNPRAVRAEDEVWAAEDFIDGWKDIIDIVEEPVSAFDRIAAYCDEDSVDFLFSVNEHSKWCYFQIYMDMDDNKDTGYPNDGGGYEFLLENGFLYKSEGGGWPGTEVDYVGYAVSADESTYIVSVPYELMQPVAKEQGYKIADRAGFLVCLLNDSWTTVYQYQDDGEVYAEPKAKVTIVSDEPYISDFELKQEKVSALTTPAMQDGVIAELSAKGGDGKNYKYSFVTSSNNGPANSYFKLDGNKIVTNRKLLEPGEYKINIKVKSGVRSEIKSFTIKVDKAAAGSVTEDLFTGDQGEWFIVKNAEATDKTGDYSLVAACSQKKFYAMISSANNDLDTRTAFVLDTDKTKGFKYFGQKGADYVVREQKLYPVIGVDKLGAPVADVDEDYYDDHVTVSFYLEDAGNPAKVKVHAFVHQREISVPAKGYLKTKKAFTMSYDKNYVYPKASYEAFVNPGMGWGCWAEVGKEGAERIAYDYSLAYLQITWADLETAQGKYDWANVEKRYSLSYWEKNNINFIIRFIMDNPAELTGSRKAETYAELVDKKFIEDKGLADGGKVTEAKVKELLAAGDYRTDMPEWLLADLFTDVLTSKLDNAGTFYNWPSVDVLGGAGFSPNYEADKVIEYHDKCIKAIADKFDGSAAYIEMGSLGHWGEMHTWPEEGSFEDYDFGSGAYPGKKAEAKYGEAYTKYFKKTKIGVRTTRDFSIKGDFGMYNDGFGDESLTEDFIVDTGKVADFWKKNFSGGEFGYGNVLAYVHNDTIMQTLAYLRESHTSWMGPCSPCDIMKGSADASIYRGNIEYLLTQMGYRFRVSKVNKIDSAKAGSKINVKLTINNEGIAPAYHDYNIVVALVPAGAKNADKNAGTGTKKLAAVSVMPGSKTEITVPVEISKKASGEYTMAVYVVDADGNKCMNLGMADKIEDKVYSLYSIKITK